MITDLGTIGKLLGGDERSQQKNVIEIKKLLETNGICLLQNYFSPKLFEKA